jgi:hypothetical protein
MLTNHEAAKQVGDLTHRELFLIGVVLYWAEGAKDKPYDRRELLKFVNSDPGVVQVYMAWLRLLGVTAERCTFRVHIHETADADAAVDYWSKIVGVAWRPFAKTTLKRHNPKTNRRNRGPDYRGCLAITVKQSADLYRRVEGWWRGISAGIPSA